MSAWFFFLAKLSDELTVMLEDVGHYVERWDPWL